MEAIPILLFGQSNADFHLAGPMIVKDEFTDDRIVVLNDGYGHRGRLGQSGGAPATGFVQALADQQSNSQRRKAQSIALPTAAALLRHTRTALSRVIIRSEAQGSRGLLGHRVGNKIQTGIYQNADGAMAGPFRNLVASTRAAITLARAQGDRVSRAFVLFLHGEQDRGLPASVYLTHLNQMIEDLADRTADLDVGIEWFILEPGGTTWQGNGNAWQPRLAMQRLSQLRPDVHVIGSGYGFPLDDGIHYSGGAKALIGEFFGAAIAARLNPGTTGLDWALRPPRPTELLRDGHHAAIRFDSDIDLLPASADPYATRAGFSLEGTRITDIQQIAPDQIRLEVPPTIDWSNSALSYAYLNFSQSRMKFAPSIFPVGRGGLRSARGLRSIVFPQKRISQWLPAFRIDLARPGPLRGADILHGTDEG